MNKKVNTILFILGATIVNIIVMAILFILCLVLIARFVNPESSLMPLWLGVMFLVSIGGSFFLYTFVMKRISAKFDMEKYLDPIFKRRGRKDTKKEI